MTFARDKSLRLFGFDPARPEDSACLGPALALAAAFVVLPFVLLLPVDVDRTLPLLSLPAVWLGWKISRPVRTPVLVLTLWLSAAMLLSTAFALYPARALVTASAALWTIAGGMVAHHLARSLPATRLVLAGIALGAALGSVLALCGAAALGRDFPLYWSLRIYAMHQFAGAIAGLGWMALSLESAAGRLSIAQDVESDAACGTPTCTQRVHGEGDTSGRLPTAWVGRPAPAAVFRLNIPGLRARLPAFVLCASACTGVAASGGRAPVLGLGVLVAAWFCRGGAADRRFLLRAIPSLAAVALLASHLIGTPYANMGWWSAVRRTATAENLGQLSSDRSDFWPEVWKQVWDAPWLGHGSDAYLFIQPRLEGSQPHDLVLQFLYDHGLFGALPALLFLALAMAPLLRRHPAGGAAASPSPLVWAAAATAGCVAYGIFDGIFYHQVVFMAAAVFTGLALGFGQEESAPALRPVQAFHPVFRPCLLLALLALLVHGVLGYTLLRARSLEPDSFPVRLLRVFPSTTFGLRQWVARWERTRPEVALEWMEWGQSHTCEQPEFHLAAVQYYFNRRDFVSAERELRECLGKVSRIEVKEVRRLLDDVSPRARAQAAAQAGNPP